MNENSFSEEKLQAMAGDFIRETHDMRFADARERLLLLLKDLAHIAFSAGVVIGGLMAQGAMPGGEELVKEMRKYNEKGGH